MADEAAILRGEEDERGYAVPPAQSDAFNTAAEAGRKLRDKILAMGKWFDEARYWDGDGGSLTANLPITKLTEAVITVNIALLRAAGFKPEVDPHERQVTLRGDDYERFNSMRNEAAAEQDELHGLDFVDPRVTPQMKIMALGVWHDAKLESGGDVTRLQVKDKQPAEIQEIIDQLRDAGFHPKLHHSNSLGPTIRLVGAEAAELMQMRKETINGFDWGASDRHSICCTIKGGPVAAAALRNALDGEGIDNYFTGAYGSSRPWAGVTGENRTAVEKIQADIKARDEERQFAAAEDNSVLRLYKPATPGSGS